MSADTAAASTRVFVNWRSAVLLGLCAAGVLTLNLMVLATDSGDANETAAAPTVLPEVLAPAETVPLAAALPTIPPVATAVPVPATAAPATAAPATSATTPPAAPAPAAPAATPAPVQTVAPATAAPTTAPLATVAPTPATTTPPPAPTTPATTPTTPAPTTVAPTTAPPESTTTEAPVTVTYPLYEMPGVAQIYLTFTDGREIEVYSVIRGENWVHQVDKNGPRSVEVKFFNVVTEQEAEFHAEVEGGTIKVEFGDD